MANNKDLSKYESIRRENNKANQRKDICDSVLSKISKKPQSDFSTNSNILRPNDSSRPKTVGKFGLKRDGNSKSKSKSKHRRVYSSYQNSPKRQQRLKKARSTENLSPEIKGFKTKSPSNYNFDTKNISQIYGERKVSNFQDAYRHLYSKLSKSISNSFLLPQKSPFLSKTERGNDSEFFSKLHNEKLQRVR